MDNQPEDLSVSGAGKRKAEVAVDLCVSPSKKNSPETKEAKHVVEAQGNGSKDKDVAAAFETFKGFKVDSILSNSAEFKRIVVEGTVNEQKAVIILDKNPFTENILGDLFSEKSILTRTFQNDIYGSYDCTLPLSVSAVKTTIVHPATAKHIEKYRVQQFYLVEETAETYKNITLPYLESNTFDIQWAYNILEHKQEADRIVFEDSDPETGFVLLPDLKWDGKTLNNLYLVAIVHKKGIKSLRDLTAEHIPLLEKVLSEGSKAILEKYGLKRSELRTYIHYQPSYYHLHIHFTALSYNAPGINIEKSHLLPVVLENIRLDSSYYQKALLPFTLRKSDKLYARLLENGYQF